MISPKIKEPLITAIMIGAGFRGQEVYGQYALQSPDKLKFVAVAEPNPERRRLFQIAHQIPDFRAYESWDDLLTDSCGKIAQTAFICTSDKLHYQPAMTALKLGYDLVLEKPISPELKECQELALMARQARRIVQVCHVLRFTKFWRKIKEIVDSGEIGQIIHYDHSENVSYWHFGHSYVRGHYKNKATSSPLILAKSCHDLDLMFWIFGKKPLTVQSTGELSYYRPENAPNNAPNRCTDGCPSSEDCPWFAPRLYLTVEPLLRIGLHAPSRFTRYAASFALNYRPVLQFLSRFNQKLAGLVNWKQFPVSSVTTDPSPAGIIKVLQEGPYGQCIYKCGNDVMDHQITTYTFPGGSTGTLTLHGVSELEGRELRIFGNKGTIRGYFRYNGEQITVTDFRYTKTRIAYKGGLSLGGHSGGDFTLLDSFVKVLSGQLDPRAAGASLADALEAHYMAFAAEDARLNHMKLTLNDYRLNE